MSEGESECWEKWCKRVSKALTHLLTHSLTFSPHSSPVTHSHPVGRVRLESGLKGREWGEMGERECGEWGKRGVKESGARGVKDRVGHDV